MKTCIVCHAPSRLHPDKAQKSKQVKHSRGDNEITLEWIYPLESSDYCYYHSKHRYFDTDPSDYQDGILRPHESIPCLKNLFPSLTRRNQDD